MEYRYKPGDKVIVGEIVKGKNYNMHSGPKFSHSWENGFGVTVSAVTIDRRKVLEGKVVTIKDYYFNRYVIDETGERTLWTDDMFLGLANENECRCESLL